MRLGATVFYNGNDPEEYALAHVQKGYRAGICPSFVSRGQPETIRAFREAFARHDILLAEVGAWCNPLSPDPKEARKNTEYMIERLRLADALGAVTCVNIIGTKCAEHWAGPSRECYEEKFFKEAVLTARHIVDSVKPTRTKLSFEIMPYCFLDSPEEYLRFLEAVDRPEVGVHLDLCNCINSPRLYYRSGEFIRHAFKLLGERILSVHLKDIRLNPAVGTVSFEEVMIGTGELDYRVLMEEMAKMPEDTPAILEHLSSEKEYDRAAQAVRSYALEAGIQV